MDRFRILLFIAVFVSSGETRDARSAQELTRCIRIAEPLVHNPDYVFPLTVIEIQNVCRMWDEFVKCVQQYIAIFLTRDQQKEFDDIIQPSMKSIHELCVPTKEYEGAYLHYAPCMKKISIENQFCGKHYTFLARLAESTADTQPAICCGYHKFRSCVLREAKHECDRDRNPAAVPSGGDSTLFVSSMLNRALGFLLQMCRPNQSDSQDCLASIATHNNHHTSNIIDYNNGHIITTTNNDPGTFTGHTRTDDSKYPSNWSPTYDPTNWTPPPSNQRPSPVTVYSPVTSRDNNRFTWTTTPRSSFFPTRNSSLAGFLSNEIREPEAFTGDSSSSKSYPSIVFTFTLSSLFILKNINAFLFL